MPAVEIRGSCCVYGKGSNYALGGYMTGTVVAGSSGTAKAKVVGHAHKRWAGLNDFCSKSQMINIVRPAHMGQTDIGGEPEKFHAYELAHARDFFNRYHHEFFRSFYFGIAPLLAIPLYQQHRSHADIYKGADGKKSCFWEHESIANYHGEGQFKHPDCVTPNITTWNVHPTW